MWEKVEAALKTIGPLLRGVDVTLCDIKDDVATVQIFVFGCGMSTPKDLALEIIDEKITEAVPEIREVVAA